MRARITVTFDTDIYVPAAESAQEAQVHLDNRLMTFREDAHDLVDHLIESPTGYDVHATLIPTSEAA